jgi:hypothetical protein
MGIYLGNLSIADIENQHGFEFVEDEKEVLQKYWHRNAEFEDGDVGWHMFDIPNSLCISNGDIGKKCLDIFMAHNSDFSFSFPAGYGNKTE